MGMGHGAWGDPPLSPAAPGGLRLIRIARSVWLCGYVRVLWRAALLQSCSCTSTFVLFLRGGEWRGEVQVLFRGVK
jgi:hypothetical protein